MKYGIYYAYWEKIWGGEYEPYIEKVKNLGFDVLEVGCHNFVNEKDGFFTSLKNVAKDHGITLTGGYGPDINHNIASDDPLMTERIFSVYKDIFRKMDLADIRFLGGGLYSYWPVDYNLPFDKKADWERSADNIKKVADMAADYGITLGMEVLNRYEGYILNTCEEAVAYVDDVDKPNVKIMLDTFHMNIEEDSFYQAIKLAGKRLGHLHLGEANRRPPHGKGRIPWRKIGEALREIDYKEAVVMEPFVRMDGQIGNDIRIWHDLSRGCSDDELTAIADESLKYLKRTFE